MTERIDYGALSDRELLVLTVKATNDISSKLHELNGTVRSNQQRIEAIEVADKIRMKLDNLTQPQPLIILSRQQVVTLCTILCGIWAVIGGIAYGAGKIAGWW